MSFAQRNEISPNVNLSTEMPTCAAAVTSGVRFPSSSQRLQSYITMLKAARPGGGSELLHKMEDNKEQSAFSTSTVGERVIAARRTQANMSLSLLATSGLPSAAVGTSRKLELPPAHATSGLIETKANSPAIAAAIARMAGPALDPPVIQTSHASVVPVSYKIGQDPAITARLSAARQRAAARRRREELDRSHHSASFVCGLLSPKEESDDVSLSPIRLKAAEQASTRLLFTPASGCDQTSPSRVNSNISSLLRRQPHNAAEAAVHEQEQYISALQHRVADLETMLQSHLSDNRRAILISPPPRQEQPGTSEDLLRTATAAASAFGLLTPGAGPRDEDLLRGSHIGGTHSPIIPPATLLVRVTIPPLAKGQDPANAPSFVVQLCDFDQSGDELLAYLLQQARIRYPTTWDAASRSRIDIWSSQSARDFVLFCADPSSCLDASGSESMGGALLHGGLGVPLKRYFPIHQAIAATRTTGITNRVRRTLLAARSVQEVPPTVLTSGGTSLNEGASKLTGKLFDLELFLFERAAIPPSDLQYDAIKKGILLD